MISEAAAYLVDAHVHLYPGMDLGTVLDAASCHMAAVGPGPGLLLLTENAGLDRFADLAGTLGGWEITPTQEEVSCLASPVAGGAPLAVVSGRQIVTAEGLEVHALGTRRVFAERQPIREVLAEVPRDGALTVLPWGFGKWSGARGKLMADLIAAPTPGLMLADSGVRLGLTSRPALLAAGEARGLKVLAGSDPLPLAREAGKAGRFGFIAGHAFDTERPFAALAAWLGNREHSPETYGRLESPLGFLYAQTAMQIRKRLG